MSTPNLFEFPSSISHVRTLVSVLLVLATVPLAAQTSPTDLADLSLTELLRTHIVEESDEDAVAAARWSVGYRYVRRAFEGYRDGTDELTFDEVLTLFPVVPTSITQEAHLVDVAYRISRTLSVSVLLPYIEQTTDHIRRVGAPFTLTSRGLGDPLVSVSYLLWGQGESALGLNMGLSLPAGSIDEKGDTPRGPDTQLPYTMQTGSGTYDLEPTLSYTRRGEKMTRGAQVLGKLRLGRNDRDYSLGDRLLMSGWLSGHWGRRIEPWVKAVAEIWGRIDGADSVLDPNLAPVADAALTGGERLDLLAGLRILFGPENRTHAIEFEGGVPVYQSLTGPQPERDWELTVGWKSQF